MYIYTVKKIKVDAKEFYKERKCMCGFVLV